MKRLPVFLKVVRVFAWAGALCALLGLPSCSSGNGGDDEITQEAQGGAPSVTLHISHSPRAAWSGSSAVSREAFGSASMYRVTVTLSGGDGYSDSKTAFIPMGSATTTLNFTGVPVGKVTASATVLNRYHYRWTGKLEDKEVSESTTSLTVPLKGAGFDLSGAGTGDIAFSTGGYIDADDYSSDADGSVVVRYGILKNDSAVYAVCTANTYTGGSFSDADSYITNNLTTVPAWAPETWRMTTIEELKAIYDQYSDFKRCYRAGISGVEESGYYWSSTPGIATAMDTKKVLYFPNGSVSEDPITGKYFALYVCKLN